MPTKTIKSNYTDLKNCTVIAGISGGIDSMCLLHYLNGLKKELNLKIIIAHLNHKIREESGEDELFVKNKASELNLTFEKKEIFVQKYANKKKINLEEAGRIVRYEFFNDLKKKYKAKYIILAHHLNDSLETSILNFSRGSFLNFLIGIEERGDILRPFLKLTKAEILDYAKKHKIEFREDKTNYDLKFSRNLIRHKVIPELKKINQNIEQTFLKNTHEWKELKNYLQNESKVFLEKNTSIPQYKKNSLIINLENFTNLPIIIQKIVLKDAIEKIDKSLSLTSTNLNEIIDMIKMGKTGKKKIFFYKIEIKLIYKGISITSIIN